MALRIRDIGFYFLLSEVSLYIVAFPERKKKKRRVSWRIRREPRLLLRMLGKMGFQRKYANHLIRLWILFEYSSSDRLKLQNCLNKDLAHSAKGTSVTRVCKTSRQHHFASYASYINRKPASSRYSIALVCFRVSASEEVWSAVHMYVSLAIRR